jgi:hypothetical protein
MSQPHKASLMDGFESGVCLTPVRLLLLASEFL